jgi:hypothetical protein
MMNRQIHDNAVQFWTDPIVDEKESLLRLVMNCPYAAGSCCSERDRERYSYWYWQKTRSNTFLSSKGFLYDKERPAIKIHLFQGNYVCGESLVQDKIDTGRMMQVCGAFLEFTNKQKTQTFNKKALKEEADLQNTFYTELSEHLMIKGHEIQ